MARVRCVMMQRDEETLIDTWFKYYGYLFGFENITVFDNGSEIESVITTLRTYEKVGCRIYWDYKRVEDFEGKGFHFTNIIRSWDHDHDYDFAIPLDCDEFLAVFSDNGISCSREAVHKYLDGLIGTKQAIGIEWSLYNVPQKPSWFRPELYRKGILPRSSIDFLDHGFHEPRSRLAPGKRETHLAYFHLHNKSYTTTIEHAKRKLAHLVDVENLSALKAYIGPGFHLINHFLLTEKEFLCKYDKVLTVRCDEFTNLLKALSASWPELAGAGDEYLTDDSNIIIRLPGKAERMGLAQEVCFSAAAYLELNSDIKNSSSTPLMHYIRFGHGEGRDFASREILSKGKLAVND